MKPFISVLMSIYNESICDIKKSIESILCQSETNFEFIIVNDNTDRTDYMDLLTEYEQKDERILIVQNEENIGLAASMNKALTIAQGNFVARMDADDISMPSRLEIEADLLNKKKCDVVFSDYTRIGSNDELLDNGEKKLNLCSEHNLIEQIIFNGVVHHPTVMMRKEAINNVNGYRLFPCAQDQDLWVRMLESGARFVYTEEVLLLYRVRETSISQNRGFQQYLTIQYILELMKERADNSGVDSFTKETYQKYIDNKCRDSQEIKRFYIAKNNLIAAKKARNEGVMLRCFRKRLSAFMQSKTLRHSYLFKLKNKNKLVSYIERRQRICWRNEIDAIT